jgi:inorganic pyrophosphatase
VDVLVVTPIPLPPGVVIRCRTIGVLKMNDEAGGDAKLLAVPVDKLSPIYKNVQTTADLPELTLNQIQHFFEHYKDLEKGKWVKVEGWFGPEEAKAEIMASAEAYQKANK